MTSKNPALYVIHIVESIERIESFLAGVTKEEWLLERMCYDAVLHNLQVMAESTKRLPQQIKDKYPNVPWRDIAGFRNVLVHDYLEGINSETVWEIVSHELHDLKTAMVAEKKLLTKN